MTLEERVVKLGLHGVLENWDQYKKQGWLEPLVECEEKARQQRGLERRLKNAKLGAFKTVVDFDWKWPKKIDRAHIEEVFFLGLRRRQFKRRTHWSQWGWQNSLRQKPSL